MSKALLSELIKKAVKDHSQEIFVVERELYRRKTFTYQEIYNYSLSICNYFKENSIKKGDKIIIYLPNSGDYVSLLFACALSGVIAVPLDFNSNQEFAEKIYNQVKAKLVFCSIFKQPQKCKKFYQEETSLIYDKFPAKEISAKLSPEDVFEIVFTSGTTSHPKGVVLTNENLYSNVISSGKVLNFNVRREAMLSILPLSHLFEQNVGLFLPIEHGVKIVYSQSRKPSKILEAITQEKIKVIVTVPLFLQTIKEKIEFEAQKKGKLAKLQKNLERFSNYPAPLKHLIFRGIYSKLSPLRYFVSGGASLDLELEKFWENLGITIIQGYGLTECSPVLTCNSPTDKKIGSLGKPLEGIEVKIHDGEIIAKGKNIFENYHNDKQKTSEVFKDGWFHTGDLGSFDEQGFLRLIGRKKNIIISPSGLNVYPEDIEKVLSSFGEIKESVVLGLDSGKTIVGCIIPSKSLTNPQKDALLQNINSKLQPHQLLSELYLWHDNEFPKTSTLKIRRGLVEEGMINRKSIKKSFKSDDKLVNILSEICKIESIKIKDSSKLISLGLDSIKRIELAVKIEEHYNLDFNESGINEKSTVRDLRQMIISSENEKPHSGINFLNSKLLHILRVPLQGLLLLGSKAIFSLDVKGKENLEIIKNEKTPVIFIANHVSMLDTFAVYRVLPFSARLNTFAAAARDFFFKNFITAAFGRIVFNAFAFSRKENVKQSLADFGEIINRGSNVLIYPEGTRSRTGQLLDFKAGVGIMAWNVGVPIIPIKIQGLADIMPVGRVIPKFGKRVSLTIGKPLKFNRTQSFQEITAILHKTLKDMK
jgi:long-chain acyl-CoA synthetase